VIPISSNTPLALIEIFKVGEKQAAAHDHFVHVYVDRATPRPVEIPEPVGARRSRSLSFHAPRKRNDGDAREHYDCAEHLPQAR